MKHFSLLLALAAALLSSAAHAVKNDGRGPLSQDYVTPYFGIYDMTNDHARNTPQFGVEYRFHEWDFGVRPTLGANIDTDGGAYAYGGINWEVPLPLDPFILIPNFMVGLYHEGGSKDLGGAVEFRSGLELAYQLANAHRVGIAFNHISNASIYDKNPGAETLLINYSLPVGALTGR